jgi:hypothetical protein
MAGENFNLAHAALAYFFPRALATRLGQKDLAWTNSLAFFSRSFMEYEADYF